jgi:hypothetical protein
VVWFSHIERRWGTNVRGVWRTNVRNGRILALLILSAGSPAAGQELNPLPTTVPLPMFNAQRPQGLQDDCFTPTTDRGERLDARSGRHGILTGFSEALDLQVGRRRIPLVGGLVPRPNIAAQAGSIDPTVTAIAFASGIQQGGPPRRTKTRVAPLRPLIGSCPSSH